MKKLIIDYIKSLAFFLCNRAVWCMLGMLLVGGALTRLSAMWYNIVKLITAHPLVMFSITGATIGGLAAFAAVMWARAFLAKDAQREAEARAKSLAEENTQLKAALNSPLQKAAAARAEYQKILAEKQIDLLRRI